MISLTFGFNAYTCRRCARVYLCPEGSDVTGCPLCARDRAEAEKANVSRYYDEAKAEAAKLRRQVASLKGQITRLRASSKEGGR